MLQAQLKPKNVHKTSLSLKIIHQNKLSQRGEKMGEFSQEASI